MSRGSRYPIAALWITASNKPSPFTCSATSRVCAMLVRSPITTASAPGTAANASCPRFSLRACKTTPCPCSTRSCAAIRPSPSEDPVMKTRAILFSFLRDWHRRRIPLWKLPLMPVRINRSNIAGLIQLRNLRGSQIPSRSTQVLPQLLLIPRPKNHGRNRRTPPQPVQRHLRHALSRLFRNRIQRIHHLVQTHVRNLRTLPCRLVQPALRRQRLPAPDL